MRSSSLQETAAQLARTPATLSTWLGDLPIDVWHLRESPEAWSPFQVLVHLVHAEDEDWVPRIRIVLEETGPRRFTSFDREGGMVKYGRQSPAQLLELFATKRRASLAALDALRITPLQLSRTANHPELGEVTLAQLLACWVTHDVAHIAQIARSLVRYHGASVGPWRAFFRLLREQPELFA
jgi:uncharacterized damage-inducible protein DinB